MLDHDVTKTKTGTQRTAARKSCGGDHRDAARKSAERWVFKRRAFRPSRPARKLASFVGFSGAI